MLTAEALTKMSAFWNRFVQEPDSVRVTGRRAHLRDVIVPVVEEQMVTTMVDMAALAAKYPSVAAALQAAGLTAQQHDAYRVALTAASVAEMAKGEAGVVERTSVLGKNLDVMNAHPEELKRLAATGMWTTP